MEKKLVVHGFMGKGYEGSCITVECSIRSGFPGFDIVGLPDSAVRESRERVRAALRARGFKFPQQRVLVNLSPAGEPKSGGLLDLGIALSILFAPTGQTVADKEPVHVLVAGELTLDGRVMKDSASIGAIEAAASYGFHCCLLPAGCGKDGKGIHHVADLTEAVEACRGILLGKGSAIDEVTDRERKEPFSGIIGMEREKMVMTYAAAGFHSMLMFGPPGVGKTLLCSRMGLLLPDLSEDEAMQTARIYGCAGIQNIDPSRPPQRMLPHDCTSAQFISGRSAKSPGEGALAHNGILMLDEITKYGPKLLECVKQSYDSGTTVCTRSGEATTYPARFLMVGNLNPCPCGGLGNREAPCSCTTQKIASHWAHIGRPMIGRFDIRIPVQGQGGIAALQEKGSTPSYKDIICNARDRMKFRFRDMDGIGCNGEVHLDSTALELFRRELEMGSAYARLSDRSPRTMIALATLARTIADCRDKEQTGDDEIEEAAELMRYGTGDYFWKIVN